MTTPEEFLEHFGVKGMKWGVRNESRNTGVPRKTDRMARKDAEEFARAKSFFGEGAGNRRKIIKQTVEGRSKKDPKYKEAFDRHLAGQDISKHATKAVAERKRIDRTTKTKQTAGAVARRFTGERGTQAAFTAAAIAGAAFLASPKGRKIMSDLSFNVMSEVNSVRYNRSHRRGADFLSDYFRRNG